LVTLQYNKNVIRDPNLYKCTVGFVGVYDLDIMFERGDLQENQSGINYMKRVLPMGEDVRVPKEHAFALRDALKAREHPAKWMMKNGRGHGFYKPENNVERWEARF
jgi:hypothetical protein